MTLLSKLLQLIIDFTFCSIVVWGLHFILSWPWIIVTMWMIFMVGVRFDDWKNNV